MNWFKRMVVRWVRDDWENSAKVGRPEMLVTSRDVEAISDGEPILNFRVFSAVGGKVLEFRNYDRQKDRNHTTTYVIPTGEDVGERVAKIINLELYKQ